jgi:site-specific recombinase
MFSFKKKKKPGFFEIVLLSGEKFSLTAKEEAIDFLVSFFKEIRPQDEKERMDAAINLQLVIQQLQEHPLLRRKLQQAILLQLINTNLNAALTESGIPLAGGFWQELGDRLKHKILPPKQDTNDFLYILNRIFYKKDDYIWVEAIPRLTWIAFFDEIGMPIGSKDKRLQQHLLEAMHTLSIQVAQLGLEKEVARFIVSSGSTKENPFLLQSYQVHELQEQISENQPVGSIQERCAILKVQLLNCQKEIEYIRHKQTEKGASLRQTYTLLILSNRLQRMQILTDVLDMDNQFDIGRFVDLFRILVRNENRKNSIREFMSQGVGYLAYQIAEHKGAKGGRYITASWKDYNTMIFSAMKGGLIIVFIAVFKNLLGKLVLAPFWQGFVYSINYSAGFIAIEQTGSTLATKQPAFTASAVAASLDTRKNTGQPNLHNLAITVAKVSRSQIASFFGNLIIVFPGTFLLAWGYDLLFNKKIAEGAAAVQLLKDQHPWQSLSLLYACNTGFFLFLSGIIAGYVQNKIQYSNIGDRLITHPALRVSMKEERRKKLAFFIEKNSGALVGSIALGFFLGMASTFGKIFGMPFDIRHITIAAGNTSIGLYGIGLTHIKWDYLLVVFFGVLGIGFLNFLVSFSLAFFVAVKSRGIRLKDYPEFLGILWRYIKRYPLDFIRPRKRIKEQE